MKAKILPVLIVAILVSSGFGMAISDDIKKENEKIKKVEMDFPQPEIVDRGEFVKVKMEGAGYTSEAGKPMLPIRTFTEKFPIGTKIIDVKCIHSPIKSMEIEKKIALAPEPIPVGLMKTAGNEPIEEPKNPFPSEWFDYRMGCGIDDGERVLFLDIHFYPVRYIQAKNIIQYVSNADIVVNYEEPLQPKVFNDEYDMLVIAPEKFSDELQELVEYKNSVDVKTILVNLEDINYAEPITLKGRDAQEKIKYYIKDAIEKWGVKYVMLVGDYTKLPVRYAWIPSGDYEDNFPSDLYYADIYNADGTFASWDTDNDGKFAEYRDDKVDLLPDVYLGRLACENENVVERVVEKIITYEESTTGQNWFNRIVVCGGDTFTSEDGDNSGVYEGEYATGEVVKVMSGFAATKLWASEGTLSDDSIVNEINSGAGFVDFSGHGNPLSWATHPPEDQSKWIGIDTSDISRLSNGDKLPVIFLDGCSCSKFDYKWKSCLGWDFVKKNNGGAIATLGASGIAYGAFGYNQVKSVMGWMELNFFKYYKQETSVIGKIWSECINGYKSKHLPLNDVDYKTCEEFELLGDPSLMIGGRGGGDKISIISPKEGYLYLFNRQIRQTRSGNTLIIGKITIKAEVSVMPNEIEKVEFYIDDKLQDIDREEPYEYQLNRPIFGWHEIKISAYVNGDTIADTMDVIIFNI